MLVIAYKANDIWHIDKVEDFCWYYVERNLCVLHNGLWNRICKVQYFKFIVKED